MTTDLMTGGLLDRGSEFIRTIQNGPESSRIYAFCGGRSLTSVLCAALNTRIAARDVYWAQRNHNLCDPNGASTTAGLHAACDLWKLTHVAWHDYDLAWRAGTWLIDVLTQAKAGNPGILMLHAGQQLTDLISGLGENGQNIQNHFIAWLGYHPGGPSDRAGGKILPEGLWCADGANLAGGNNRANPSGAFNAANVLQFYPITTLYAAWPCGMVVVRGYQEAVKPMAWTQQPDGSGKDDKAHTCGSGMFAELTKLNKLSVDGMASETHYAASGTADTAYLPLVDGTLLHAVQQTAGGPWFQDQNAAQVAVDLQSIIEAQAAEIAQLKQELQTPPPPPQPPTPAPAPDPRTQAAVAMLDAIEAAIAIPAAKAAA